MIIFHIWWIGVLLSLFVLWIICQWKMSKSREIDDDDAAWFFLFCVIWPLSAVIGGALLATAGFVQLFTRQILFKPSPAKQKCKAKAAMDTMSKFGR